MLLLRSPGLQCLPSSNITNQDGEFNMHTKRQYESQSFPRRADHTENNALRRAKKEIISRNHAQISCSDNVTRNIICASRVGVGASFINSAMPRAGGYANAKHSAHRSCPVMILKCKMQPTRVTTAELKTRRATNCIA